jgi:hypothetical protein
VKAVKLTKGNLTKILSNAGLSKSVVTRGRVISGMTEGFQYVDFYGQQDNDVVILEYTKASSSYLGWDKFQPRHTERMGRMLTALSEAGFNVTLSPSGDYLYVKQVA